MDIRIQINTDGAAFDDGWGGLIETARILRALADRFEHPGEHPGFEYDINGNRACVVEYEEGESDDTAP